MHSSSPRIRRRNLIISENSFCLIFVRRVVSFSAYTCSNCVYSFTLERFLVCRKEEVKVLVLLINVLLITFCRQRMRKTVLDWILLEWMCSVLP